MERISKELLKQAVKTVWLRSLTEIPQDVLTALKEAEEKETSSRGKNVCRS